MIVNDSSMASPWLPLARALGFLACLVSIGSATLVVPGWLILTERPLIALLVVVPAWELTKAARSVYLDELGRWRATAAAVRAARVDTARQDKVARIAGPVDEVLVPPTEAFPVTGARVAVSARLFEPTLHALPRAEQPTMRLPQVPAVTG